MSITRAQHEDLRAACQLAKSSNRDHVLRQEGPIIRTDVGGTVTIILAFVADMEEWLLACRKLTNTTLTVNSQQRTITFKP